MEISSAHAVAANIAPTAKQIILLAFILIPFRSETRQISKIHTFQLQRGGRLRSIAPTYVDSFLELTLVLGGVEMAFRFADETVPVDLPKFVASDSNFVSLAAGSGVGSR